MLSNEENDKINRINEWDESANVYEYTNSQIRSYSLIRLNSQIRFIMSKKHKNFYQQAAATNSPGAAHAAEYRIIKHDLFKVLILNVIYLAAVLAVYFTNSKSHYLEHWFGKVFHF